MMRLRMLLAALAAVLMIACSGNPSSDKDSITQETGSDTHVTNNPVCTTGVHITCTLNGKNTDTQAWLNGQVIGNTDTDLFKLPDGTCLEPGVAEVTCGDEDMTTLDGFPYYVASSDYYYVAGGSMTMELIEGQANVRQMQLIKAPRHQCVAVDCEYTEPFEYIQGMVCDGHDYQHPPQWIYVNDDNSIHGSEVSSVVSGVEMYFDGERLVVESLIPSTTIVNDSVNFDLSTLTLSFVYVDNNFDVAQQVTCPLE